MDQPTPGDGPLPKDLYRPPEAAPEGETDATTQSHQAYVTLLFNKYRAALQRYLRRFVLAEDAAELVQEAYFRLLRRGELLHVEPMARAFLFETATNLARDLRRRRATRHADQHVQLDGQEIAEDHQRPDEQLAAEQVRAILERAIAGLPQDTRTVFLLHRYRDLSYPQIAQLMNLSARTVARKMAEAIERLSTALGGAA
ncbi:MAG: sigma-70 family RNA polymerase sigma factor [Proteobacteria bacterium]|nr:sigma-70 family RNA polymerase sigma factor [Pseudomonadota bacterium]